MPSTQQLYERIAQHDEKIACKEVSVEALPHVPANFFRQLASQFSIKLGDALSSSTIILPGLMAAAGAPTVLLGMLVPIRESGSLIPQVFIGSIIRQYRLRKMLYVNGCLAQALAVIGMALCAVLLNGFFAGLGILVCLSLFSLARGLCSVTSKDVLGKTIPKTRRGRLGGLSTSATGFVSMGVGVALFLGLLNNNSLLLVLLLVASLCWFFAAWVFSQVKEYPGEVDEKALTLSTTFKNFKLLNTDPLFRRFILARCLLLSSALAAPYVVILAQQQESWVLASGVGLLIVVSGLASLVSGAVWGKFADLSSRKVMILTALLTCILCMITAGLSLWMKANSYAYALIFFLLAIVHQGVRLGRQTYIVDIAQGNKRTEYVTVGNTVVGVLLLFMGLIGALLAQFSLVVVFLIFALSSCVAAFFAFKLPEA